MLMVEHNMSVVANIADQITVLQFGQVLAEGALRRVSRNPQVLEATGQRRRGPLQGAHWLKRTHEPVPTPAIA